MSEENKALIRRWFEEVWNQGRADTIDELVDDNIVIHGLADKDDNVVEGVHAFREFHRQFHGAFPDMAITVEDVIAEGDRVAARCSVRAKHTGETLGIAASNFPVEFDGIAIVKIKDGKFVEAWNNFDFLKMNRQLGVL
jgi:steroid delta-isomerase-like uncharacterized protein